MDCLALQTIRTKEVIISHWNLLRTSHTSLIMGSTTTDHREIFS